MDGVSASCDQAEQQKVPQEGSHHKVETPTLQEDQPARETGGEENKKAEKPEEHLEPVSPSCVPLPDSPWPPTPKPFTPSSSVSSSPSSFEAVPEIDMFEAAATRFVKSVGHGSLIPVPNLDESAKCQPLQVVVKKSRYWSWQSPRYEPTPFLLSQLVQNEDASEVLTKDLLVSTRELTTYDKASDFSISGKVGGKLKHLVDLELNASDSIKIHAQFGDVIKEEVDQPKLMQSIQNMKLQLEHDFVQQVHEDQRKILCAIVGSAKLAKDGSVSATVVAGGEESVEVAGKGEDASVKDDTTKTIGIPQGTVLAYNLCELLVKKDGSLELIVEKGVKGGFSYDQADGAAADDDKDMDESDDLLHLPYQAMTQCSTEERRELANTVQELCVLPNDVTELLKIVKAADIGKDVKTAPNLKNIHNVEPAKNLLLRAGLTVQEDLSVTFPERPSGYLETFHSVLASLDELDDEQTVALSRFHGALADKFMVVLLHYLDGETDTSKIKKLSAALQDNQSAMDLAVALGMEEKDGVLVDVQCSNFELEATYRVLYALWGTSSKKSRGCTIL